MAGLGYVRVFGPDLLAVQMIRVPPAGWGSVGVYPSEIAEAIGDALDGLSDRFQRPAEPFCLSCLFAERIQRFL